VTGLIEKIDLEIQVPPSFPKEYYSALIRSAEPMQSKKDVRAAASVRGGDEGSGNSLDSTLPSPRFDCASTPFSANERGVKSRDALSD
jgi:hypothetical protein